MTMLWMSIICSLPLWMTLTMRSSLFLSSNLNYFSFCQSFNDLTRMTIRMATRIVTPSVATHYFIISSGGDKGLYLWR